MKTIVPQLLKSRLVQAGGLLAIIAAFAASMAWSRPPGPTVRLAGAWIAQADNGIRVLFTYAPSDASGLNATLRIQMVWPPEALASLGLDAVTDEIAEASITGINTAAYTGIWYGLAGGRIAMIFVDDCTFTFNSPSQTVAEHTISAYLATADADHDGYPDPGSTPVATFPSVTTGKRLAR